MLRGLLLALPLLLAGCGGMNRAVGVLPNTLDDLAARSRAARGLPEPPSPQDNRRTASP